MHVTPVPSGALAQLVMLPLIYLSASALSGFKSPPTGSSVFGFTPELNMERVHAHGPHRHCDGLCNLSSSVPENVDLENYQCQASGPFRSATNEPICHTGDDSWRFSVGVNCSLIDNDFHNNPMSSAGIHPSNTDLPPVLGTQPMHTQTMLLIGRQAAARQATNDVQTCALAQPPPSPPSSLLWSQPSPPSPPPLPLADGVCATRHHVRPFLALSPPPDPTSSTLICAAHATWSCDRMNRL